MRPKPQRLSLFLADVDGTLVDENKVLTDRAAAAVRELRRRGVRFAVTSGRPPRGMAMLVEPLALDTAIAGFNGGVFVSSDLSIIAEKTLSRTAAETAVRTILDHGLDAWVYAGTDWLIRNKAAPHVARETWTVKFEPTVTDDLSVGFGRAAKVVGVSDDYDRVAASAEVLGPVSNRTRVTSVACRLKTAKLNPPQVRVSPRGSGWPGPMRRDTSSFTPGLSNHCGCRLSHTTSRPTRIWLGQSTD